jgi:hypothetical protein
VIADHYPVKVRGQVLAWFYMATPVGSALGYPRPPMRDPFLHC